MLRWTCPECDSPVRMVRSNLRPGGDGVSYQQCTEPACGWCGTAFNLVKDTFRKSALSRSEQDELSQHNRRVRPARPVEWNCPCCGTPARIRTSIQPYADFRETYLECMEPRCGWRGKGEFEVRLTISPSALPNPKYRRRMSEHMPAPYRQADLFREEPTI